MKTPRKRRTKSEMEAAKRHKAIIEENETKSKINEEPKGLGDSVENVLEKTGIAKVAKFILGEDCNCDKRKETLNKLFPYRQPKCLTEEEYAYLDDFFKNRTNTITIKHQERLLVIYNRTLNQKETMSSCTQCWKERINQLKKMYNEYKKD